MKGCGTSWSQENLADLNKASLPQTWHKTLFLNTHTHTHTHTHIFFCCGPFYLKILLDSFLMWTIFSLYWICYHIVSVLCFGFLAMRHVGSWLPYQGSNPHPLHWKVKSSPWTAKEVLFFFFLNSFSISVLGAKFCGMWFGKCHFTEHLHVHLLIDPWNRQVLLYWF